MVSFSVLRRNAECEVVLFKVQLPQLSLLIKTESPAALVTSDEKMPARANAMRFASARRASGRDLQNGRFANFLQT